MRSIQSFAAHTLFLIMVFATLGLTGCASEKRHDKESLLSAAGFRTMTPSTPEQQASYAALPPSKMQRLDRNGKVIYAYADKHAGVVYVGGEAEYQRYKQLGEQQKIADEQMEAAEMDQNAAMNWGYWGPGWR